MSGPCPDPARCSEEGPGLFSDFSLADVEREEACRRDLWGGLLEPRIIGYPLELRPLGRNTQEEGLLWVVDGEVDQPLAQPNTPEEGAAA
jgi:hypothetical protein